jgi:predicted Na+-dependent transporter
LFVVFLAVIFFMLGHSMVRHRFFQGGRTHRNGSVGQ